MPCSERERTGEPAYVTLIPDLDGVAPGCVLTATGNVSLLRARTRALGRRRAPADSEPSACQTPPLVTVTAGRSRWPFSERKAMIVFGLVWPGSPRLRPDLGL